MNTLKLRLEEKFMLKYKLVFACFVVNIVLCLILFENNQSFGQVKVSAFVTKNADTLIFSYSIKNLSTGSQKVDNFAAHFFAPIFYASIPAQRLSPQGWWGEVMSDTNIFSWGSSYDSSDIIAGATLLGYKLMSFGLPSITSSYSWYFAEPDSGEPEGDEAVSIFFDAMVNKTIVPKTPTSPLNKYNFIDSLRGYINQSRVLNWITSDTTANKYNRLYDSIKSELLQNNVRKARLTMDTVLTNEMQDSTAGRLILEAQALIKFNTQYLKAQVPQTPIDTLTLTTIGIGSVTKAPSQADYDSGMTVWLTATATANNHFVNWSGSKTGSINPDTVRMTSNRFVTANFAIDTLIITASAGANGSISPSGNVKVTYGANQSFTITPSTGYNIDSVIVNGTYKGTMSSYTFNNVRGDSTIRAVFKVKTYIITTTLVGGGTISPSGSVSVNHGANQRFTYSANANNILDSVIVDGVKKDSTVGYTFYNVTTGHTIKVKFKYTITTQLQQNWNIVSVPLIVPDFRKAIIYPQAITPAYAYTTSYVQKDTLAPGIGYWVKFPGQTTVTYTGIKNDVETVAVVNGWNLIGSISNALAVTSIQQLPTNIVTSPYYGYTTGYIVADSLRPGNGYWVKVNANGSIILNSDTAGSVPPITPIQPPQPPGAPPPPTLASPINNAVNQSLTPTLSWNVSEEATTYRLQVATSSAFTSPLVYDNGTLTNTYQQIGTLAHSTTYYWKVSASNSFGTSNWSGIRWFTTVAAAPPCTECCITSPTSLDQLTVVDANGNAQQMYVYNSHRKLHMGFTDTEMPPEPLPGVFSARFNSNKLFESVPPGNTPKKFSIKVKNAKAPLSLRWNISPENNIRYWLVRTGKSQSKVELKAAGSIDAGSSGTITIELQAEPPPCEQ